MSRPTYDVIRSEAVRHAVRNEMRSLERAFEFSDSEEEDEAPVAKPQAPTIPPKDGIRGDKSTYRRDFTGVGSLSKVDKTHFMPRNEITAFREAVSKAVKFR
eukprot:tig00021012_g17015.t1